MADFNLGGLLGGGGGLYDDLLTPQQQSQLSSRGLLAMAGAFADAGMPSRLPIPLGAAIGKAAAAMGTGRDQAALQMLQAQKVGQEVQSMKMQSALQQQFMDDLRSGTLSALVKAVMAGRGPPGVGIPAAPGGGAAAPAAAPRAAPGPAAAGGQYAPPAGLLQGGLDSDPSSGNTGVMLPPAPPGYDSDLSGSPAAAPAMKASSLDTVLPRPGGPGGLLTPASYNDAAAPGGGDAAWLNANAPFPTLQRPAGAPIQWANAPPSGVPFGQDPGDSLPGGGAGTPPFGADGEAASRSGGDAQRERDLALTRQYESGNRNIMQNVVGPQGGYNPSVGRVTGPSSAGGYYQITDPTWRDAAAKAGIDTQQYPKAITAPFELQHAAAQKLYDEQGNKPWDPYNAPLARARAGGESPAGGAPDEVVGAGGGVPGVIRAQYSGAAPGASGAPTPPVPPGVDPQAMNSLLLELAKRNAMAEILKLGNPYGSMLSVLQGSPEYQAQIEAAKRGVGLGFIEQEKGAEERGRYPYLAAMEAFKTANQGYLKDREQYGAAFYEPAPNGILVPDPATGGTKRVQGTREQFARATRGLGVPELGIPALVNPPPGALPPGSNAPAGPSANAPVVSPVGERVVPPMSDAQKMTLDTNLKATSDRLKGYHDEGQAAAEQVTNAASIGDLLGRVRMGWSANTRQEGARLLAGLGVPQDSIQQFLGTDPSAGDALNKLFLQFSAGAVRNMGAREPGSVISLFAKAYPNLETMPHAAELMNNALRMQAQWKQDRANAAEQHALDQQRGMGQFGENYKGMLGFEQKFGQSNDPRHYWQAAAAMSNEPDIAWAGASAADKQRIFDLIPAGSWFRASDGKPYRKPGP